MNGCNVRRILLILAAVLSMSWAHAGEFSMTDTQGKPHSLAVHKGKWVLVNFWATWCPPCLEEIPEFSSLYNDRKNKDLMIIGVAVDYDDSKQVEQFAKKLNLSYPLVMGDDDITQQFGKVSALPVSILYDPKGKQMLRRIGTLTRAEIEKLISK